MRHAAERRDEENARPVLGAGTIGRMADPSGFSPQPEATGFEPVEYSQDAIPGRRHNIWPSDRLKGYNRPVADPIGV